MNAYELAKYLNRLNGYMDMPVNVLEITQPSADMLRKQADRIAELEKQLQGYQTTTKHYREKSEQQIYKPVDIWTSCLDCGQRVTGDSIHTCSPQIKELSDEEIADMVCSGEYWELSEGQVIIAVHFDKFARAILKKARNN